MTGAEAKEAVLEMFAEHLDARLGEHGFRRSRRGFDYKRKLPDAEQWLRMVWRRPSHQGDYCDAHVTPYWILMMPRVAEQVKILVPDTEILYNTANQVDSLPIGFLGPERNLVDWQGTGREGILACGPQIFAYLERWVLPFLDEYTSPERLAEGVRKEDPRFRFSDYSVIQYAGAFAAVGDYAGAHEFLTRRFAKRPGLRRRYAHALEYTQQMAQQSV